MSSAVLTHEQLQQYDELGYITTGKILPQADFESFKDVIENYPASHAEGVRPEHLDKPHIQNFEFLRYCSHPAILDVVEQLIGPNIVLFSSHLIAKAKGDGFAVPWHQDANYWPLEPMEVTPLWLAIDDSLFENGCMRVIPGSHKAVPDGHRKARDPEQLVLDQEMPPELVDQGRAVDLVLRAGEASFHAPYLTHGSNRNLSPKRRARMKMRFMPATTRLERGGDGTRWWANHPLYLLRGEDRAGVNRYVNV